MKKVSIAFYCIAVAIMASCGNQQNKKEEIMDEREQYRPQYHFSPKSGWMNDPNGMVYLNGTYHFFFQHNPDSTVWGPMHWGHATSTDLVHWEEQPIALFPDSLGTIFSGSAVVDKDNTAGFGENAIVAIFTHHNDAIEKERTGLHQYQSLAYSTDEGKTWTKYEGNPVLPNPGIWDFRDPKVMWHEASKQWVMTLATKQSVTFYASPNLKEWNRLSEFGEGIGAHGGVWECPDLIELDSDKGKKWVLLVSINPGGPNTGSATQYFIGQFDGTHFKSDHTDTRWIDYGPEDYAGVTFFNTGDRKIFIGWMNNWEYANEIPATTWRGGATIARDLKLKDVDGQLFVVSEPVKELETIYGEAGEEAEVTVTDAYDLTDKVKRFKGQYSLEFELDAAKDFTIHLVNSKQEEVVIGYDAKDNNYYVDRSKSGNTDFKDNFVLKATAPRIAKGKLSLRLLVDVNSVELFADGGLSVLSNLFFPSEVLDGLRIAAPEQLTLKNLKYQGINSIL
ncbi:glycoside hydrolase family 32 protein [Olivibacter sitiensis]|uniref:glycoside hydrolase family 32 protein n=1 Tax=Olivibacter sitiensis TaxID=376470 RepID=UPI0004202B18|nr:glycoside hydrolase family 32 protein [Olivibacter sitiensis]